MGRRKLKMKEEIWVSAKFPGYCVFCGGYIQVGEPIIFDPEDGMYHPDCWGNYSQPIFAGFSPEEIAERLHALSGLPLKERREARLALAAELKAAGVDPFSIRDYWLRRRVVQLLKIGE